MSSARPLHLSPSHRCLGAVPQQKLARSVGNGFIDGLLQAGDTLAGRAFPGPLPSKPNRNRSRKLPEKQALHFLEAASVAGEGLTARRTLRCFYAIRPCARTRASSLRQLPTDHGCAVPTRGYQSDQPSHLLLPACRAASCLHAPGESSYEYFQIAFISPLRDA